MSLRWKYLIPHFRRTEEREMQEELTALTEIAGRRELGNVTLAAENARMVWGWTWLEGLLADIRYAIRSLRRQPSFTVVAVGFLALRIGAHNGIFRLLVGLLLGGLPVCDSARVGTISNNSHSYFGYTRFAE